ncbi:helix-turn-helix domain-containing protein [Mesorhizobium sp. PAMC28654]|uniref:transcriptional regulator n=1 Tax=Mesorhizobium sp. PAMC28654 TaxID=2880934 RepID=UPI001D09B6FB|nr:Cro/CI family transcriptional regulator [Mesorhizobium sp. PAMC28654]UDL89148.1 helix-turn-helix domain-containing protein [Mesorhizobium sp. PAMC28654]
MKESLAYIFELCLYLVMQKLRPLSALDLALQRAGSASALARLLRVTPSAVLQWQDVPARRVLEVEQFTGVSRHALRPDIFGPAPQSAVSRSSAQNRAMVDPTGDAA